MRNIMSRNGKILTRGGLALTTPRPEFDYVVIGNQRWMKKNLAIDDGEGEIYTVTVDFGQGYITEYYYTYLAAVRVANSIPGWHLPSKEEFETLIETVGSSTAGTKLKSTYGWMDDGNGTDDYGFTGLPAGFYDDGTMVEIGYEGDFWTSTAYPSAQAYAYGLSSYQVEMIPMTSPGNLGFSVRLIKDVD